MQGLLKCNSRKGDGKGKTLSKMPSVTCKDIVKTRNTYNKNNS
jgi:hypothetical protein